MYPPKPLKNHCHSKVLRRGGGKAPNAPKVVDLSVFPLKKVGLMRISWNYCWFHVFSLFHVFLKRGASGRPKHMKRHCVYKVSEQERRRGSKSQGIGIFFFPAKNTKFKNFTWKNMKFHENSWKYGFPSTCAASSPQNHWKTIAIARFSGGLARVVAPGPKGEEMEGI